MGFMHLSLLDDRLLKKKLISAEKTLLKSIFYLFKC